MRNRLFNWKWMALLAVPALFLIVAGCEDTDDPVDEEASGEGVAAEAEVAEEAAMDKHRKGKHRRDGHGSGKIGHKKGHRGKGHCPSGKLLRYALKELDLTDEQRATLETLRDSHKDAKGAGHRDASADFHEAFVKALETGELDRAALETKMGSKDDMVAKKLEARNAKLATLHATLTPPQRKTLVDTVRAKMEQKAEKHGDRADVERKGKHGKGKRGHHGKDMLGHMLKGIELTADQQAQIDALHAKGEAQRPADQDWSKKKEEKLAQLNTLLDAFEADAFDPSVSAPTPKPMKDPMDKIGFHIEQFETLLGILTAEQRAQLAEKVKSHPDKMGHRGMMGMKGPGCGGGGDCPGSCPGSCAGDCPGNCPGNCPFADGE
ncbi:MAG: Spy/CpxP family protein refolding chaperone [Deltaproteobacteria bacterium]|nr:Spy/CpxP family protein refolding chaperone [Deltaproteobacteria bacterium]